MNVADRERLRMVPGINWTLKTLQAGIVNTESATGIRLTTLRMSREALAVLKSETEPSMTKKEIEAAIGLKIKLI